MSAIIEAPANPFVASGRTRSSIKRIAIIALSFAAAFAVALYAQHWMTVGRFLESTDDAYVGGDVTVISPKISGFIAAVAVADNQIVHAGDVLLRIDDRDYRAALAKADALVAAQQASLANFEATRRLQESVIAQAKAGIAAADAETTRAREDQIRYRSLSARTAVSVQSSQKADADYEQAVANGRKAQATLAAALQQLNVIGTQKQQAQAAIEQAIADRDIARLNLSYTVLRSPIDGTVDRRT